ncbi:MAG: GyrI-like domain-containing protein [Candidatus Helarchaeota archaeon]
MSTTDPLVKEISPIRVISKRERGIVGGTIQKLIGEIMGQIFNPSNQGQVQISGPPMYICHDESYKETDMDVEVAVPITGRIVVNPEYEVKTLPGGKVISVVYTGKYSEIGEAYTKIFEYAQKNNYKQRAPTRELYLTNPNEKPAEENMTELILPIE